MSIKPRQQRYSRKKGFYIFLLILLICLGFLIKSIFFSASALISPLGKGNSDTAKVKKALRQNNISFSEIVVLSDSSYVVSIANKGQVRFSSQKDIVKQISSLQRILRELTIEGKLFKSIDFRFEEPIISF